MAFEPGDHVATKDGASASIVEKAGKDKYLVAIPVERPKFGNEGDILIATIEHKEIPTVELEAWTEEHEKAHVEDRGTEWTEQHEISFRSG
jgi:hypothetical protein